MLTWVTAFLQQKVHNLGVGAIERGSQGRIEANELRSATLSGPLANIIHCGPHRL